MHWLFCILIKATLPAENEKLTMFIHNILKTGGMKMIRYIAIPLLLGVILTGCASGKIRKEREIKQLIYRHKLSLLKGKIRLLTGQKISLKKLRKKLVQRKQNQPPQSETAEPTQIQDNETPLVETRADLPIRRPNIPEPQIINIPEETVVVPMTDRSRPLNQSFVTKKKTSKTQSR